jgi:HEAT repeat protein
MNASGKIILCVMLAVGCRQEAPAPEHPPRGTPISNRLADPYSAFTDTSNTHLTRLIAGIIIARVAEGPAYLAGQYYSGRSALVRSVLDSLETTDPDQAAWLAASLLKNAPGEEKLDFEIVLLRLGNVSVKPLTSLISTHADLQTRLQALDALGKLGSRASFESITACLQDSSTWIRMGAAHALGNLSGPQVLVALSEVLDDTSDVVVAASLVALGKSGDPQSLPHIHPLLTHRNPRVRSAAASALGRLGQKESLNHLEQLLTDPDEGVRFKATRAARAIGSNSEDQSP